MRADITSTSDIYVAAWAGAVGADLNIITLLGQPCRAIRVGHGGALVVTRKDGAVVTVPAGPDGEQLNVQAIAVTAVGSAAYNLLLLA